MTQSTRKGFSAPTFKRNADAAVENNDIQAFLSSFPSEKAYLTYCRTAVDLEKRRRLLLNKNLLSEREKENYDSLVKKVQFIQAASEVFRKQKTENDAARAVQEAEELDAEKRDEEARIAEDECYSNLSEDEDDDGDDLMPSEYMGPFGKELLF